MTFIVELIFLVLMKVMMMMMEMTIDDEDNDYHRRQECSNYMNMTGNAAREKICFFTSSP